MTISKFNEHGLVLNVSLFRDLNECQGEGGGHTCHPTTHCINTEGGYQCVCVDEENCVKSEFKLC